MNWWEEAEDDERALVVARLLFVLVVVVGASLLGWRWVQSNRPTPPSCMEIQWLAAGKIVHVERTPAASFDAAAGRLEWGAAPHRVVYHLPTAAGWKLIEVACEEAP